MQKNEDFKFKNIYIYIFLCPENLSQIKGKFNTRLLFLILHNSLYWMPQWLSSLGAGGPSYTTAFPIHPTLTPCCLIFWYHHKWDAKPTESLHKGYKNIFGLLLSGHPVYLKLFSFVGGRWESEARQRLWIPRDVICNLPASLLSVL